MKAFFFLLILFLAFSCSKEEDDPSLKYTRKYRIKKIIGSGNETIFNYNEKGLLTKINNSVLESYEITYNASNLPVKIVSYYQGRPTDYYYSITWGQNQFTFTIMPEENHLSVTCYTINENKIDRRITKKRAEDGRELMSYENCTWFGEDSLYVDVTYFDNRRWTDKYKFGFNSIFKNINLAVLVITQTSLLFDVYQNNWLETQWVSEDDSKTWIDYMIFSDYIGPRVANKYNNFGNIDFLQFEYELY